MSLEFRIAPPPQRCVSSTTISTSSFHNPSQRPQPPYFTNHRQPSTQSATANYSHLDRASESGANLHDKSSWMNANAQQQRGFESSFRSAIERMRLSSETRLEMMGKESSPSQLQPSMSHNKSSNDSNSNIRQNVRVSTSQIPNSFSHKSDNTGWSQTYTANGSNNPRGPAYARSTSTSNFTSGASPWEMADCQQEILRPSQNEKQSFDVSQTNGQASVQQRQTSSTFVRPAANNRNRPDDAPKYSTSEDPCGVYDNLDNYALHKNQASGQVINDSRAASLGMHKPQNHGRFESVSSTMARSSSLNRDNQSSSSVRIPIRHQSVSDMYSTLPNTNSKKWFENDSSSYASGGSVSLVTSNPVQRVVSQTSQHVYASGGGSSQSNYATQKYNQPVPDTKTTEKRSHSLENGSRERLYSSNQVDAASMKQEPETEVKDLTLPSVKEIIRQVEAITKEMETNEVCDNVKSSTLQVNHGYSSLTPSAHHAHQNSGRTLSHSNPMTLNYSSISPRITSSTTIQSSASSQTSPLTSIRKGSEARSSLNHLPSAATFSTLTSQRKSSDPTISRKSIQLPSDYQRLREAFVEQRNEIQRLRRELLNKDKEITNLQQNMRLYKERYGNINCYN